jgi:hypothetical protein
MESFPGEFLIERAAIQRQSCGLSRNLNPKVNE